MTLSLRGTVRGRRAIGAIAAAGVVLFASFGLDASLADASADAVDTAAAAEGSANAGAGAEQADTSGESGNDLGGGGATTTAPAPSTTGGSPASTTSAPATTSTTAATTTTTPASTTTGTATTTTTTPPSTTTTVEYLGVATATTVPLPAGAVGGVRVDGDLNGLAPPASLGVPTTASRPTTPSTVAPQRGATADESATKQVPGGATDASTALNPAPTTAATAAPTTSVPAPTLPPLPTIDVSRPATSVAVRTVYESAHVATVLVSGVEPVPSGGRSSDGTTITLQFPWDSSQRIGVQLHASRLPSLWTVWMVIALLLMAFWLPGSKRQHAVARRSNR